MRQNLTLYDVAYLTSADFEKYPPLEVDRSSYKLNQIDAPRINQEYWFLEARKSWRDGADFIAYHITKMHLLFVTRNRKDGKMALDTVRFISGNWNRRIYEYSTLKGFSANGMHMLFESREALGRYAMHQKLLGVDMVDLSEENGFEDSFAEPLVVVRPIAYPVTGRSTELGNYLAHLSKELSWTYGIFLNSTSSQLVSQLLSQNPNLKLILADTFQIQFARGFLNGSSSAKRATVHRGSMNQYEMNKDRNILVDWSKADTFGANRFILRVEDPMDTAPLIKDGSLGFIYIHSSLLGSKEFKAHLDTWLPKLKPNGWLVGTGIQRKHINDIVVERFPNWQLGYHGSWITQIAG